MSTEGDRDHRKYSPSQAETFIACPGAPDLLARTPARAKTPYIIEGEEAHHVIEAGIRAGSRTALEAIAESTFCCESDRFEAKFCSAVQTALDYVWDVYDRLEVLYGDPLIFLESYVNPPSEVAPGETGGYLDVAIYTAIGRWLYVIDYKHGEGVVKEVNNNFQLLQYGGGLLYEDNPRVDPTSIDGLTCAIIQPNAFHEDGDCREFDTTPAAVWDYLTKLDEAIWASMQPNASLIPGDHCRLCRAKSTCPAVEARALGVFGETVRTISQVKSNALPLPNSIDGERLGRIVLMRPNVIEWLNACEAHAKELTEQGFKVPGTKLVEPNARRQYFYSEEQTATRAAALIGCTPQEVYKVVLPTLTELEERVKDAFKKRASRGMKNKAAQEANRMMAFLTIKQSSGNLTLVSEDDPRPATTRALQAFGGINITPPPTERTT